ncbi:MAG: hypothetical protein M1840_001235 [Geoglossum simile]|nr:MAG: hypothetical protein M1840_001235 [Geoglossum simile]
MEEFMGEDPLEYLKQCSEENFRHFLNWELHTSGVSKKSTIELEWRYLRLIYRQKTGRRPDVGKFIPHQSTIQATLDTD